MFTCFDTLQKHLDTDDGTGCAMHSVTWQKMVLLVFSTVLAKMLLNKCEADQPVSM